ncbi:MAG: hypothetical protein JSU72_12455 [Deltaproteobacteria bacterium]|nr:MAG: hypothetical protein JSU72_12455 [Deltaproteobacteria bacterium]
MKVQHILLILCLLFKTAVPAYADDERPVVGDAYFDSYDKTVVETLREKLKDETGDDYDRLTDEQKGKMLQTYIEAYRRKNHAENLLVQIRNKPMTFFGKVVDEGGQPVEAAIVTMTVEQERMVGKEFLVKQTLSNKYVATTDKMGAFVIEDAVGWRITLNDIQAQGYLFDTGKQPSLSFFPIRHASNLKAEYFFRENKKFPVVFVLVKEKKGK